MISIHQNPLDKRWYLYYGSSRIANKRGYTDLQAARRARARIDQGHDLPSRTQHIKQIPPAS